MMKTVDSGSKNNVMRSTSIENFRSARMERRSTSNGNFRIDLNERRALPINGQGVPIEIQKKDINWSLIIWATLGITSIIIFFTLLLLGAAIFRPY